MHVRKTRASRRTARLRKQHFTDFDPHGVGRFVHKHWPRQRPRTGLRSRSRRIWRASSPQVRGRREKRRACVNAGGLIPAGAGQTSPPRTQRAYAWAHPRGCGADDILNPDDFLARGSSPRVRGRRQIRVVVAGQIGLIPAGAGQTAGLAATTWTARAHPRGCGADDQNEVVIRRGQGSSPRVRGRPTWPPFWLRARGLIPAGAGQTYAYRNSGGVTKAHPRGCGADASHCSASRWVDGSSPRVRGRLQLRETRSIPAGLIPAGAGQTRRGPRSSSSPGAHPRGCGAD